ncbi:MAG: chemotaxis protein CheW [Candidatus Bathyarchaeota archaeon]|nr:chemotaxis protein CheW [Candidatus Bathyarchaeota archaeon]
MSNADNETATAAEMKMLTFTLDNVFYGVDVHQVREVKNFEGATPVPYAPPYVKGVTNLRGEIIPVIDLRKRIGLDDNKGNENAGIMIIVQDKHPIGVIVDSVIEVLTLQRKDVETGAECLLNDRADGVVGIAKHEKDLIIILDIIKILSNDKLDSMKESIKGFQIQMNKQKDNQ